MSYDSGTWTCHVCKDERPDAQISVMKHATMIRGIEVQQNVRYCNDRPECVDGATDFRHFGAEEKG
jgi:hypothetical protein